MGLHPKSLGEQSLLQNTAGRGLATGMWLQGLPEVELLEPRETGGLEIFVPGRAFSMTEDSIVLSRTMVGLVFTHHQEEFTGKYFPLLVLPFFPCAEVHRVTGEGRALEHLWLTEGLWVGSELCRNLVFA